MIRCSNRLKAAILIAFVSLFTQGIFAQQEPQPAAGGDEATARADQARYFFKFAAAAIKKGDYVVAEEKLIEAVALVPDNALIWYNLGTVQSKNHKIYPALDSVNKAMSLGLEPADRESAEDLLIELSYTMSKPPQEARILLNTVFFGVDIPKGPNERSKRIEDMGETIAKSLVRTITTDTNVYLRGTAQYENAVLAKLPECSTTLPQKFNVEKYAVLKTQWFQCIESQVRSRSTEIRDHLRRDGYDAFIILALEATQGRKLQENPTVTGSMYLVSKEGHVSKIDKIAGTSMTINGLPELVAASNREAVKLAAQSIRLLAPR